ncbi:ribonuclease Y [Paramuribaculum intestinale]|uniref:ribonuclease Y n=1 Tax=Paramuribaculum intestinale TaxID=2094151 RepID=UPI0027317A11|nr:ribonuclease Y [Paramuribaculum intestinale]
MTTIILILITAIVALAIGAVAAMIVQRNMATSRARTIIDEAKKEAEVIKKDRLLEAREEEIKIKAEAERQAQQRISKVQQAESKIKQREMQLNQQQGENQRARNEIEQTRQRLDEQLAMAESKKAELDSLRHKAQEELEHISGLTAEEAKDKLVESLKDEAKTAAASYINDIMDDAKMTANKEAKRIVVQSIQRVATETAIENSVTVFQIDSDDPARIEEVVAKVRKQIEEEIIETGKRTAIDLGIHGLHPDLIRLVGKMKYRSSYGQNLLQHSRETANLCAVMASELGLNPKKARRAGLLHDIGKVPDEEPELPHALLGMKLAEKYKEKPEICNAIGAHHDEIEQTSLLAPIVQVCDAISGARPGARREIVEAYIKRLNDLEQLALSYPGVIKTYAIQAGRELRVIVGADKIDDVETEKLSAEIAKRIQDEMTYPGQVKITVIRETRSVSFAK